MLIAEMLEEIKRLRKEIATETPGSIRLGELTVALVVIYDMYVQQTEKLVATAKKVA